MLLSDLHQRDIIIFTSDVIIITLSMPSAIGFYFDLKFY